MSFSKGCAFGSLGAAAATWYYIDYKIIQPQRTQNNILKEKVVKLHSLNASLVADFKPLLHDANCWRASEAVFRDPKANKGLEKILNGCRQNQ